MINIQERGLFNGHSVVSYDLNNIANYNNTNAYSQLLKGTSHSPSLDYLLNFHKLRLSDYKSISFYNSSALALKQEKARKLEEILDEHTISLPAPRKSIRANFLDVLKSRRSIRAFSNDLMNLKDFSTIIKYSFGVSEETQTALDVQAHLRYYPSGGGLYPITIALVIHHIESLSPGIYSYQPYSHSIRPLGIKKSAKLGSYFSGVDFDIENSSFATFFIYETNRNYLKYGELALFNAFVEAGAMIQTQYLVTNALLYEVCAIAGIDKPFIEQCIDADGIVEHVLCATICGRKQS